MVDGRTIYALTREGRHDVNRFSARVQSAGLSAADDAECEANARLMASAPDLLDALREARELLSVGVPIQHSDLVAVENCLRAADAAIAKATGP